MNHEQAVIGCLCLDSRALETVHKAGVFVEWFSDPLCRACFSAAIGMYDVGKAIDVLTLEPYAVRLDPGADIVFLSRCTDEALTVENLGGYLEHVREQYLARTAHAMLMQQEDSLSQVEPGGVDELLSQMQQDWSTLAIKPEEDVSMAEIGDMILAEYENPNKTVGLLWPIHIMNRVLAPITDELIYLAGVESSGKTALALQILISLAEHGHIVSMASMESKLKKLLPRIISQVGNVDTYRLKFPGEHDPKDMQRVRDALATIKTLPMRISERAMTMAQLCAWGHSEKRAGSELLIIDNMKHIRLNNTESTVAMFRELSIKLKWMRDDVGLPMIVLHHLTDSGDVSWSKDIKRDADILLYIFPDTDKEIVPGPENGMRGESFANIEVKKNREGPAGGAMPLEFLKRYQYFREGGVHLDD